MGLCCFRVVVPAVESEAVAACPPGNCLCACLNGNVTRFAALVVEVVLYKIHFLCRLSAAAPDERARSERDENAQQNGNRSFTFFHEVQISFSIGLISFMIFDGKHAPRYVFMREARTVREF